jgi:hypothetical protein
VELASADLGGSVELDLAAAVPRVRRQGATSAV